MPACIHPLLLRSVIVWLFINKVERRVNHAFDYKYSGINDKLMSNLLSFLMMADVHDRKTRSYNMSRIKGKNTKPELIVRKYLHAKGLRFRLHDKKLPGKPDIVLPKYKAIVQVHGCFWHKHEGCKYFVVPKTRTAWWIEKINKTVRKDKENESKLVQLGWRVFTVWECELKKAKLEETLITLHERITCQN